MYIDDFIKELEQWKSKTAEVTISGRVTDIGINRITCSELGDRITIIPGGRLYIDDYTESLEDKLEDLKCAYDEDEWSLEADWQHIEDLEGVLTKALSLLRDYEKYLDEKTLYNPYTQEDKKKELKSVIESSAKVLYHWEY